MEPTAFLNSSGAIVAPSGESRFAAHIFAAPYIEQVALPVVSVDSSALYGDHPENLATLTYSSGAALTFFCDSEAGGTNTSGDGSFENPWRSLKTASNYLSCNECALRAAASYIQLKIKGDAGYVSGNWSPFTYPQALILTGWGGVCNLGHQASYGAGYMFNLAGACAYWNGTYSNCTISGGSLMSYQKAISCEMSASGDTQYPLSTYTLMYDCHVFGNPTWTSVCYQCNIEYPAQTRPFYSWYWYNTTITVRPAPDTYSPMTNDYRLCYVRSAAVNTRINASGLKTVPNDLGLVYYNIFNTPQSSAVYLRNCSAYMEISANRQIYARLFSGYDTWDSSVVINGGAYTIINSCVQIASGSTVVASAYVRGAVAATVNNVDFRLSASAVASALNKSSDWSEEEIESTMLLANSCYIYRHRYTRYGEPTSSSTSSGTCPLT